MRITRLASALLLVEAALIALGRTYGSTTAERAKELPGDSVVRRPTTVTDHAITIDAPPQDVWPWLVQMGWGRAGWYTARWVDVLLFPANGPSADGVLPEHQNLQIGDFVPDGPPETQCGFTVVDVQTERALVLHSSSHLPLQWRQIATLDWSWDFQLTPLPERRTRFHFRSRWKTSPWWLTAAGWLLIVPADFVMARSMLRGVRRRTEALTAEPPSPGG